MGKALLKEVPKLKAWPHFSGEGEYEHMEFIRGIDMIKEDFVLPERFVTERFEKSSHRWYIKLRQANRHQSWTWWQTHIISNGPMMLGDLKGKQPLNLPHVILTKKELYPGFANRSTDYQHYILTCQNS
ncbi:hypothetical protein O181_009392 [Austropuccinia psidii MF-1]|uniref:Uncharacterized protein n=1 Tax=Austropuccinia psidii MF-1 TaxID=1389203 RepID=A0A9Q3GKA0_9BASI|nr:hypothetical protein [Austropuccinia psidii MF-1]